MPVMKPAPPSENDLRLQRGTYVSCKNKLAEAIYVHEDTIMLDDCWTVAPTSHTPAVMVRD